MKIELLKKSKIEREKVYVGTLKPGDTFKHEDSFYLCTVRMTDDMAEWYHGINMETGEDMIISLETNESNYDADGKPTQWADILVTPILLTAMEKEI